jgi:hypothetical protein
MAGPIVQNEHTSKKEFLLSFYLNKFYCRPTWEDSTVACRAVSKQRLGIHVHAATDTHATMEVHLETVFSTRCLQSSYKEGS